jgi:hypothetical protein
MIQILPNFRPSSHSDNYTVVADFQNEKAAKKVATELHDKSVKNQVISRVTGVYLVEAEEIEEDLKKAGAIKTQILTSYQKLLIRISAPEGAREELLPLFLSHATIEVLRTLRKLCKKPVEEKKDGKTCLVFRYVGERIFYRDERSKRTIFFFGSQDFPTDENVQVKVLLDE